MIRCSEDAERCSAAAVGSLGSKSGTLVLREEVGNRWATPSGGTGCVGVTAGRSVRVVCCEFATDSEWSQKLLEKDLRKNLILSTRWITMDCTLRCWMELPTARAIAAALRERAPCRAPSLALRRAAAQQHRHAPALLVRSPLRNLSSRSEVVTAKANAGTAPRSKFRSHPSNASPAVSSRFSACAAAAPR